MNFSRIKEINIKNAVDLVIHILPKDKCGIFGGYEIDKSCKKEIETLHSGNELFLDFKNLNEKKELFLKYKDLETLNIRDSSCELKIGSDVKTNIKAANSALSMSNFYLKEFNCDFHDVALNLFGFLVENFTLKTTMHSKINFNEGFINNLIADFELYTVVNSKNAYVNKAKRVKTTSNFREVNLNIINSVAFSGKKELTLNVSSKTDKRAFIDSPTASEENNESVVFNVCPELTKMQEVLSDDFTIDKMLSDNKVSVSNYVKYSRPAFVNDDLFHKVTYLENSLNSLIDKIDDITDIVNEGDENTKVSAWFVAHLNADRECEKLEKLMVVYKEELNNYYQDEMCTDSFDFKIKMIKDSIKILKHNRDISSAVIAKDQERINYLNEQFEKERMQSKEHEKANKKGNNLCLEVD